MKRNLNTCSKILLIFTFAVFVACQGNVEPESEQVRKHENGTYRGVFIDKDAIQVNVEFTLTEGVISDAGFRHLRRDDDYHLETETEPYRSVVKQYKEALGYMVGKDVEEHLADLYNPENVVTTQVDGYTSATIRAQKVISAIRDGLNRGVYSY